MSKKSASVDTMNRPSTSAEVRGGRKQRTRGAAVGALLAAAAGAVIVASPAPAHALPNTQVCVYDVPLDGSVLGLTATVCLQRSSNYVQAQVWVENLTNDFVFLNNADAYTNLESPSPLSGTVTIAPGQTWFTTGVWVQDKTPTTANFATAAFDFYTGTTPWFRSFRQNSPWG